MFRNLTITLICTSLCAAAYGKQFETYTILTPDADALVQMAQAIGGAENKVVYDKSSGKLMVYAPASVHESIKTLLKDVNTIPHNIKLEVIVHEAGKARSAAMSAGLSGSVTISGSGGKANISAKPSVSANSSNSDVMTSQILLVRSGGEAIISVGKEVPFLSYLLVLGRNWGYIQPEIEIRKVGASLRVKAVMVGNTDLITVTLTPVLSGLVENKITMIRYTKVATTVTIRNGETITIGSFGENSAFYDKFLAGFRGGEKSTSVNITLTANATQPQAIIAPSSESGM